MACHISIFQVLCRKIMQSQSHYVHNLIAILHSILKSYTILWYYSVIPQLSANEIELTGLLNTVIGS